MDNTERQNPHRPSDLNLDAGKFKVAGGGEVLFEHLLESTPDAMIIVDGVGTIVLVNRQTEHMFGYGREDLLGQSLDMLIPERFRESHREYLQRYRQAPRIRPMGTAIEIWALRKDGSEFPAEISLGPLETQQGLLILSAHRDITERKHMEQMLREKDAQFLAAQRIQERLLPGSSPALPGFDIFGACHPAEFAAGDHFDFLCLSEQRLGVVIGDVVGHGIGSALVMASTHAYLRSFSETFAGIDDILKHTNRLLYRGTEDRVFVTMLFVQLDTKSRELTYASAGHPTAFILGRNGEVKTALSSTSLPLGILPDLAIGISSPVKLETGDVAIMFTDGLIEATSPDDEPFGEERVLEVARRNGGGSARSMAEALYGAAVDFAGTSQLADDITMVVVKVE